MTLRPGEVPGRGIAVFPFLKTTHPIQLGSFSFRSTDDTSDLEKQDAANVREIADMLFLKDELRIRSASYALLPPLDLDKVDPGSTVFMQSCSAAAQNILLAAHARAYVPESLRGRGVH